MNVRHVKRIDELARSVPPPRDLWPAIHAAIEAEQSSQAAAPKRMRWMPAAGMAAAVALVAVGVLIGRSFGPVQYVQTAATQQTGAGVIPAALRDANYRQQRDLLAVEVQHKLDGMPAAERAKVAASLATLRRSIGEIEAALGRDPANALLQELLVNSCQEEMRALTAVRDSGSQEI
jgi:N-acyl-D-aspartate/D-glutamate deacylase